MVGIPKFYTGRSVFNFFFVKQNIQLLHYRFFTYVNLYPEGVWENFISATSI
jgi:hypothetical protein